MKNQWGRLFLYFVVIAVITAAVLWVPTIGEGQWMPDSIAKESESIDLLFWGLTGLSIIILALVMAVVIYAVTHFKARHGDESDGAPIHGNHRLEVVWTLIPTIIVVVVGVLSYIVLVDNERAYAGNDKQQTVVQVRAFSFGWGFRYGERQAQAHEVSGQQRSAAKAPVDFTYDDVLEGGKEAKNAPWSYEWSDLADDGEEVFEASNLVLPIGKPVFFEVMSCSRREPEDTRCGRRYGKPLEKVNDTDRDDDYGDVTHAFWVPEARMKIDAVPGIPTWTQFTPTEVTQPGEQYQVVCAELCGSGHNAMRVDACVVSDEIFGWWLENATTTCETIRFFNCEELGDASDGERTELRSKIEELVADEPEATCDDAKEIA